jgi:hypothetical protein
MSILNSGFYFELSAEVSRCIGAVSAKSSTTILTCAFDFSVSMLSYRPGRCFAVANLLNVPAVVHRHNIATQSFFGASSADPQEITSMEFQDASCR